MTATKVNQTETVVEDTTAKASRKVLTLQDRCDNCKAQAFVYAYKIDNGEALELFFCGHHGYEYTAKLGEQGFNVEDNRHLINAKNESSN